MIRYNTIRHWNTISIMRYSIIKQGDNIFKRSNNGFFIKEPRNFRNIFNLKNIISVFVPKNYPNSVTKEYTKFSALSLIGTISGTIANTISTQLLLQALGVSNGVATAASATINWIIKDGIGLSGGIIYSALVSTKFDSEPKRQRFRSRLFFNIAYILEASCIFYPSAFLLIASGSNILKNIAFLAASASNTSINTSFLQKNQSNNLGDITVKMGAQKTLGGLIGTASGIGLSLLFGATPTILLFTFIPINIINVISLYFSTKTIIIKSLNPERAEILMSNYFNNGTIFTPKAISALESFIINHRSKYDIKLIINERLDKKTLQLTDDELLNNNQNEKFKIISRNNIIYLWFIEEASTNDIIKGLFYANKYRHTLEFPSEQEFEEFYIQLNNSEWNIDNVYINSNFIKLENLV